MQEFTHEQVPFQPMATIVHNIIRLYTKHSTLLLFYSLEESMPFYVSYICGCYWDDVFFGPHFSIFWCEKNSAHWCSFARRSNLKARLSNSMHRAPGLGNREGRGCRFVSYCWWLKSGINSPVEVAIIIIPHYLFQAFIHPSWLFWDFFHQQYESNSFLEDHPTS